MLESQLLEQIKIGQGLGRKRISTVEGGHQDNFLKVLLRLVPRLYLL